MQLFQIEAYKIYTEQPDQSIFVPHAHDVFELFCFLSGNAIYSVEGNIYQLSPGDIIVLQNTEMHYLILRKSVPYTRFSIYFKPDCGLSSEDKAALLAPFVNRPIGLYNQYQASQFRDRHWVYYLEELCRTLPNPSAWIRSATAFISAKRNSPAILSEIWEPQLGIISSPSAFYWPAA